MTEFVIGSKCRVLLVVVVLVVIMLLLCIKVGEGYEEFTSEEVTDRFLCAVFFCFGFAEVLDGRLSKGLRLWGD